MTKIKNIRQKRPARKFRLPSSVVQWGIVGIVVVVLVVLVVGALSRPAAEPTPIPLLSTARTDLISVTRMLGDVMLDSSTHSWLQEELGARLAGPDSLFAQRRWYDALTALNKMFKGATRSESAAIRAYMGFCDHEADNLDRSLQAFRKSLAHDSRRPGIDPRLQFSIAWMFQSRGYQDSAIAYYALARRDAPDSARLLKAEAANNAGVAYEVIKDTSAAGNAYREAAALLDTSEYPKESKTIRENLARLARSR